MSSIESEILQEAIEDSLEQALRLWKSEAELIEVYQLTPDASLRRYYRVRYAEGEEEKSVIATIFDSVDSPEAGGNATLNSFDSVLQVNRFLREGGIPVPEIYFSWKGSSWLIFQEDLGDQMLISVLQDEQRRGEVESLYKSALDILLRLQRQSRRDRDSCIAFHRSFSQLTYKKEMAEFWEFYAQYLPESESLIAPFNNLISQLASELHHHKLVLTHRDYHSWNLMVDGENTVRVIDYQDALVAPRTYDLVALINDRDTDSLLRKSLHRELCEYFRTELQLGGEFYEEFDRVSLQRDLKVAGRFSKLSQERGLKQYEAWIPGTLKRIGNTLERLALSGDTKIRSITGGNPYKDFYSVIRQYLS
jgi:aminoglycoside/choline kinase family phosphotransferase